MRSFWVIIAMAAFAGAPAFSQEPVEPPAVSDLVAPTSAQDASDAILGLWDVGEDSGAQVRFDDGGAFTYYEANGETHLGDWDIRAGSAGTLEIVTWPPVWPDVAFGDIETLRFTDTDGVVIGEAVALARAEIPELVTPPVITAPVADGPVLDGGDDVAPVISEPSQPVIEDNGEPRDWDDAGPSIRRDFPVIAPSAEALAAEALLIGRWRAPDFSYVSYVDFAAEGRMEISEDGSTVVPGHWRVEDEFGGGLVLIIEPEGQSTQRDPLLVLTEDEILIGQDVTLTRVHPQPSAQLTLTPVEAVEFLVGTWVGREDGEDGEMTFFADGRLSARPPWTDTPMLGRWDVILVNGRLAVRAWRDDRGPEPETVALEILDETSIILDGVTTLTRVDQAREPLAPTAEEAEALLPGVWEAAAENVMIAFSGDGRYLTVMNGDFDNQEVGLWALEPTMNGGLSLVAYRDDEFAPNPLGVIRFLDADTIEMEDGARLVRVSQPYRGETPAGEGVEAPRPEPQPDPQPEPLPEPSPEPLPEPLPGPGPDIDADPGALIGVWRGEFAGRLSEATLSPNFQFRLRDLSAGPAADQRGFWNATALGEGAYEVTITLPPETGSADTVLRVTFLTPSVIEVDADGDITVMRRAS